MFRLTFGGKLVKKVIADKLADSVLNQLDFNTGHFLFDTGIKFIIIIPLAGRFFLHV